MKLNTRWVLLLSVTLLSLVLISSSVLAAPVKLELYQAMSGGRGRVLEGIVDKYNESQDEVFVELIFAGTYDECFTKSLSAYRAGNQPHMVMIEAAFLKTIIDSGAIYSLDELVEKTGIDPGLGDIIEPIYRYYAIDDTLYSLPFASSTGIIYYNKDALRAAGVDPDIPPRTFADVERMSRAVQEKDVPGIRHYVTSSWPTWIMLENLFPYHDQAFADKNNGHDGFASKIYLDTEFGHEIVEMFTRWAHEGLYSYMGREYDTVPTFVSGESVFLLLSTSTLGSVLETADFEVGTAFMPKLEGYPRGTSTIGGVSLGVFKGFSDEEYEALMKFLSYWLSIEPMVTWHKGTGYFPITNQALLELLYSGWFQESPNHLTALMQLLSGRVTQNTAAPVLGNFVEIRETLDRYLEEAYTFQLTPDQAIKDADKAIARILAEYEEMYR
ncbi:MAG: ABC transporter substrate-binding protein [Firmicutes bacterium]|nr:ABC transporter substrate-binding protein [Bacillota bacterium]